MIRRATVEKWHAGELAPYAFSRYFVRKVREVDETGIVEGEFLRLNSDGALSVMATFTFSRVDWRLETHSLLMNKKSKMFEEFDEKIAGMMRDIYPAKITLEPKKNKKSSEPLGVDDIKNAAFLMFESLKNTVLLDKENLEVRVIRNVDKDTCAVTMTTYVIDKIEDVVLWTQALDELSRSKQAEGEALEEFFLHRLPEA